MNGQTVIRHLTHRYYATVILFSYVLIVCKWTAFFFSKEMKSLILHRIEKGRLYYELNNFSTIENRHVNVKICPSKYYILSKETIEIFCFTIILHQLYANNFTSTIYANILVSSFKLFKLNVSL